MGKGRTRALTELMGLVPQVACGVKFPTSHHPTSDPPPTIHASTHTALGLSLSSSPHSQPYDPGDPKETIWGIVHDPSGGRSEVSPTGPEGGDVRGESMWERHSALNLTPPASPDNVLANMFAFSPSVLATRSPSTKTGTRLIPPHPLIFLTILHTSVMRVSLPKVEQSHRHAALLVLLMVRLTIALSL
ncbi:hypothetical protein SKAU_G00275860 [Synaphobranchus kaupii]|uniref:Uncharacterized protein n=1 Tax=Synaphobranchus kaupii TaxID=118154 RepID=A0A9Q1F179_SYNKA|nr:hypothetical protein SKAU_G00275860 [Synaphobranchus kaupii]